MAAPRVSDNPEVQQHYATQFALSAALLAALRRLWPSLDPENLAATFEPLRRGAAALGGRSALAAVSFAADYYEDLRAETIPARFSAPTIDAPTAEQMEARLEAATRDMLAEIPSLVDELYLADVTRQIEAEAEVALQAMVADAASNEIFAALGDDSRAKGWARVTRPNACYFCRMLATRGPVYLTKQTANFRAHVPIDGRGGVCKCTVEPLFSEHYEAPAHIRTDMGTWERVTDGLTGRDALNEFRRAIEGRSDGKRSPRRRKGDPVRKSQPAKDSLGQRLGFEHLTPTQLRHHLTIVEALPDSDYRSRQLKRLTARLAELGA